MGNSTPKKVNIERFGWTIEVPKGWKISSLVENKYWKLRGEEALKKRVSKNIDTDAFKSLLMLNTGFGSKNMLAASYTKYDKAVDKDYEFSKKMRMMAMERMFRGRRGVEVKSKYEPVTIDGLDFDAQFLDISKNGKKVIKMVSMERKYDNDDILLIQCSTRPEFFDNILNSILNSKFSRKN